MEDFYTKSSRRKTVSVKSEERKKKCCSCSSSICSCSWCKSPKTWCRFFCILTSLAHSVLYAVLCCILLLSLRLSDYFPLAKIGGDHQKELMTLLMTANFILCIPYLIVSASGTRNNTKLLLSVFLICTTELLMWLGLILFAVMISVENVHDIYQWMILTAMVSLLFMTWTLLLMAWKRKRQEEIEGTFTATLMTSSIIEVKEDQDPDWWPNQTVTQDGIIEISV